MNPMMKEADVLAIVPVHRNTLARMVASGRFPAPVKAGATKLYRSEDVAAFAAGKWGVAN